MFHFYLNFWREITLLQHAQLEQLKTIFKREKYQLVGSHSAVKKCRWLHESLVNSRICYKQKFYGIQSHRCLQMTPSAFYCTLRCLHCWRVQPEDLKIEDVFDEVNFPAGDNPELIVEESLKAQRRILTGYKAHNKIERVKYQEALEPTHAAISLTGEPTLYPSLNDLICEFHKRKMTTFLVTNGTIPEALSKLSSEPSQLYISLQAPNEDLFNKICRPQITTAWRKVEKSLGMLKSFKNPTVLRLTLTKNLNMENIEAYAKIISKAQSTYVEAKAYMFVGFSRQRLNFTNMPTHKEIKSFSEKLSKLTGYNVVDEARENRVVLLSEKDKPKRITTNKSIGNVNSDCP